jgi:hypothetical protein
MTTEEAKVSSLSPFVYSGVAADSSVVLIKSPARETIESTRRSVPRPPSIRTREIYRHAHFLERSPAIRPRKGERRRQRWGFRRNVQREGSGQTGQSRRCEYSSTCTTRSQKMGARGQVSTRRSSLRFVQNLLLSLHRFGEVAHP